MKPGRRRVARNLVIAACAGGGGLVVAWLLRSGQPSFRASVATADVGLTLLAITLVLGPINVLTGRPNPVSTHLRRDLGIWGGLISLAHVVIGLQRHMKGRWWLYFTFPGRSGRLFGLRYDIFGLTNWIGLAATLVVAVLICISSDAALRRLGTSRWKWLQRSNYVLFLGVVVHGFFYQSVSGGHKAARASVLAATALGVVIFQTLGVRRVHALAKSVTGHPGRDERTARPGR